MCMKKTEIQRSEMTSPELSEKATDLEEFRTIREAGEGTQGLVNRANGEKANNSTSQGGPDI